MFPNYVLWFGRSILVLLCDDTNHETLVGIKKSEEKGGGGLAPETFFRTTPSRTSENASFQNRICLVSIIEVYMEKGKLIPQTDFIEFCRPRTRNGKAPPSSHFPVECLYLKTKTKATLGRIYLAWTTWNVTTLKLSKQIILLLWMKMEIKQQYF